MTKDKIIQVMKKILLNKRNFWIISLLSIIMVVIFNNYGIYNGSLIAIMIFFIYSVASSLCEFKKNILVIIMLGCFFTFILSRPLISFLSGEKWWYFPDGAVVQALFSIILSLIFLMIGSHIKVKEKNNMKKANRFFEYKTIRVLFLFMMLCWAVNVYVEVYNYIALHGSDYSSVYTSIVPDHHIIIRVVSSMYIYVCMLYLATMPSRKYTYLTLILFVLTTVPSFLLGSRNALVLHLIFSLVYLILRDFLQYDKKEFITKRMKNAIIVCIPILVLFLGAYNYIRDNKGVESNSIWHLIVDTFDKQGTTFDTICQGFVYEDKLKESKKVSYAFGDIIDYIIHNRLSQMIFKTSAFPSGNSLIRIREGNSVAHKLSYYVLGEFSYLGGHGRGTSYIIETYLDGSYFLLEIYSMIIGLFLANAFNILKKRKYLLTVIILIILNDIFLLPRFSASGFISFLVKPYFWIGYLLFYFGNKVYIRRQER